MKVIKFKTQTVQQLPVTNQDTKVQELVEVTFNNDHTIVADEIKGWTLQEVTAPLKDEEGNMKMETEVNLILTLKEKTMDWQMVKEPRIVKKKEGTSVEYKEVLKEVEINRVINLSGAEVDLVLAQLANL